MAMYAKVRRMRVRDGLSIREIARRTSLSRNTIKEWLRGPVRSEMRYRQPQAPKTIDPYEATLRQALEADERVIRSGGLTVVRRGQPDGEGAALAGDAGDVNRSAVGLDDRPRDGKP